MTREGTSVNRKQVNASVKWSILGAFWGAFQASEEKVCITFWYIRLHVFDAYLVSISLDSISILLVFYYDYYY